MTARDELDVQRAVVDVVLPSGERRLVVVSVVDGRLHAVDERGDTRPDVIDAAVEWLRRDVSRGHTTGPLPSLSPTSRSSLAPRSQRAPDAAREVALAFFRVGTRGARRGAIEDTLRRCAASPDLAVQRWCARFGAALQREDLSLLTHLARGALDRGGGDVRSLVDRRLVDIGREHLDGVRPLWIERRYLVDLHDGAVLTEERERDGVASVGPSPRVLEAGLVEVEAPRRVARIQQYTLAVGISEEVHARLSALALTSLEDVFELVEAELSVGAGLAEPVVLFRPASVGHAVRLADARDGSVPWSREDFAACSLLDAWTRRAELVWVALRAAPSDGSHAFVPVSAGVREAGRVAIVRLRG